MVREEDGTHWPDNRCQGMPDLDPELSKKKTTLTVVNVLISKI